MRLLEYGVSCHSFQSDGKVEQEFLLVDILCDSVDL